MDIILRDINYFANREKSFGSVAIYVKKNIESYKIYNEEFQKSNILGIKLGKQNMNIFGIYRAHETHINSFISKIDDIILQYKKTIILGDMNLNLLNTINTELNLYKDIILSNGFLIFNKISEEFSTRFGQNSKTIIDHLISDIFNCKYRFYILDTCLSDHQLFLESLDRSPKL